MGHPEKNLAVNYPAREDGTAFSGHRPRKLIR